MMEFDFSYFLMGFTFSLLITYLIQVYPLYKMYQRANLKNPSFAFIPFVGGLKSYNLADFSMWLYLLILILLFIPIIGPVINMIISIYINYKIYKNFNIKDIWVIIGLFFPTITNYYIALTNVEFIGNINKKYLNEYPKDNTEEYNL